MSTAPRLGAVEHYGGTEKKIDLAYCFFYKFYEILKHRGKKMNTVKPEYNALEGTGPRERSRRENVIRGK